jgi:acyl-coenzyme A thioesterase PaaI-like protein
VKAGSRVCFCEGVVSDEQGQVVASATSTLVVLSGLG